MNFIKKNLNKFYFLVFAFFMPFFMVHADTPLTITCDPASGKVCNPIGVSTLNEFIKIILQGVIKIGIPVIALAVIYCGFLFVQARGNPEAIQKAKDSLLYTLIGAAILLGAWAIAQLISNTILAL